MSQDGARGRYAGGSVAGGRYQLRDLLGEGGMASVYLAYDSSLDRQVAIKTLHTELAREQSFRERFRREAQAVAKLSHPNIVSVFDTGEDTLFETGSTAGAGSMMPYIVMEYVEGQPLGTLLQSDIAEYGAMPADRALKLTADVLAALEASHEMGLVHRDIKPGNVMMSKRGVVKVMDFGIARAMQSGVTSMTQTGMVVGTPQYLSPEQALGRAVDARSDLYSVGIMLFQLLTGRLPFDADSPLAIAYAHVQEEPVAPSSINRSLTPAIDALVARALKKNPNERFPNAASMAEECRRVLPGQGQTGTPAIVQGAPHTSGAGVSSAVFPPVDQSAPAPGPFGVQPSYPTAPQTPQHQPGPYGPPTPGYGYPQAAPAYQNQVAHTQAPYGPQPPGGGPAGSGRRNLPVIVGSVVLAVLAIGGLVTYLTNQGDTTKEPTDDRAKSSESAEPAGDFLPPDRSRTIDPSKCTDPREDVSDPSKVEVPDFRYKDVISVKECLQKAGWALETTTTVINGQWPKEAVIQQYPVKGTAMDPKTVKFTLTLSSGSAQ